MTKWEALNCVYQFGGVRPDGSLVREDLREQFLEHLKALESNGLIELVFQITERGLKEWEQQ